MLNLIILGAVALGAFLLFRPIYRQMVLGHHLTRLTNLMEQAEANRLIGVDLESLPLAQQQAMEADFERGVTVFRQYPPMLITRELLKNSVVAKGLGRELRERSIHKLIEALAQVGVAMRIQDFEREMFLADHGL